MGAGLPHGLIRSRLLQGAGAEAAGGVCTCVVVGGMLPSMQPSMRRFPTPAEVALLTQRAPPLAG